MVEPEIASGQPLEAAATSSPLDSQLNPSLSNLSVFYSE